MRDKTKILLDMRELLTRCIGSIGWTLLDDGWRRFCGIVIVQNPPTHFTMDTLFVVVVGGGGSSVMLMTTLTFL